MKQHYKPFPIPISLKHAVIIVPSEKFQHYFFLFIWLLTRQQGGLFF